MDKPASAHHSVRRYLGPAVFTLIILFLALYLKSIDFHKLAHLDINWWWLVPASLLALVGRYWAIMVWRVILRSLGSQQLPDYELMAYVFAKAWMARYIPGTITWVAGRIYMASQYGISKSRLTVSSLLEGGMQVVAGIVSSLLFIAMDGHVDAVSTPVKVLSILVSLAGVITLLPPVFNRLLGLAHRIIKHKPASDELRVNGQAVWRSFTLFVIANVIIGTANFMVAKSIDPTLPNNLYLYLVGTFGLAGAIGIAIPFLPSGIGVRDGVQLVLLSLVVPKEIALSIVILSRLWSVAVDGLFFGVARLHYQHWQRHQPN